MTYDIVLTVLILTNFILSRILSHKNSKEKAEYKAEIAKLKEEIKQLTTK